MSRQRQFWAPRPGSSDAKLLRDVTDVLHDEEYRPFWPLTLRQLYYALVGRLCIENTKKEYKRLGCLITKARLSGHVLWAAIMDNNREMHASAGYADADEFVNESVRYFLEGYSRNLAQSQPTVLEIWVEKDALARVVHDVAKDYSLTTVVAKGYSSVSYVNELRNRVQSNNEDDKPTKILYFGDLDPSGWNMLPAMFITLYDEMGLSSRDVTYERCALNPDQVRKYKLPQNPDALKDDEWQRTRGDATKTKGDPRAEAYKKQFGNLAVELDAFSPRTLQSVVRAAIERNFDMDAYRDEESRQVQDLTRLHTLKRRVAKLLKDV